MVSPKLASALKKAKDMGRGGDTMLAHINPTEAKILKSLGGSGTINPHTGLPQFDNPSMGSYDGGGDTADSRDPTGWGNEGASYGNLTNIGGGSGEGGALAAARAADRSSVVGYSADPVSSNAYEIGGTGGYDRNDLSFNTSPDHMTGASGFANSLASGLGEKITNGMVSVGDALNGWISDAQPTVSSWGNQVSNGLINASDALNNGLSNGFQFAKDYVTNAMSPSAPQGPSYTQMAALSGPSGLGVGAESAVSNPPTSSSFPSIASDWADPNSYIGGSRLVGYGGSGGTVYENFGNINDTPAPTRAPMREYLEQQNLSVGAGGRVSDAVASARAASAATGLPESVFMSSTTLNPAWNGAPTKDNLDAQANAARQVLGNKAEGLRSEYLQGLGNAVAIMGNKTGVPMTAVSGFRSPEVQAALYAQGRTTEGPIVTNAPAGSSFHNWGLATDMVPASLVNTPNWSPNSPLWNEWGSAAKQAGLTWGGEFSKLYDPAHTQYGTGSPSQVADALDKANPIAPSNQVASTAPIVPQQAPQQSFPTTYEVDGSKLLADIRANNWTFGADDKTLIDKVIATNPESVKYDEKTGKFTVELGDANKDGQINKEDYNAVLAGLKEKNVDPTAYTVPLGPPTRTGGAPNPIMAGMGIAEPTVSPVDVPLMQQVATNASTVPHLGVYDAPIGVNPNAYASALNLPAQPNTALGTAFDTAIGLTPMGIPNTIAHLFGSSAGDMLANQANVPVSPEDAAAIELAQFAATGSNKDGNGSTSSASSLVDRAKTLMSSLTKTDTAWKQAARNFGYSEAQLNDPETAALIKQIYDMGFIPAA